MILNCVPFDPNEFAPEDIDGPTLKMFGKLAVDCTRDELTYLVGLFQGAGENAAKEADALAAEKQRRFGADIVRFPGGGA